MQSISFIHITLTVGVKYVVLKENELCGKPNTIGSDNVCREAAEFTGTGRITTETEASYPRGCYENNGEVYFNSHSVGNRETYSSPICLKGKFIIHK